MSYTLIYYFYEDESSNTQKRYAFDLCKSRPCQNNGFCERLDNSRFECNCQIGHYGQFCENSKRR